MNTAAVLALIGDLYDQVATLQRENQELQEALTAQTALTDLVASRPASEDGDSPA